MNLKNMTIGLGDVIVRQYVHNGIHADGYIM